MNSLTKSQEKFFNVLNWITMKETENPEINYRKFSNLKQYNFIISQFSWVGNPGTD